MWYQSLDSLLIMFFPKRTKYRKYRKGSIKGFELKNKDLKFGFYGLKSLESGRITAKQIKPYGKVWVRIFAHLPVSSKPSEVRMGKGKGNFSYWSGVVKKGQILFEISGVSKEIAFYSLKLGSDKLPFKTKVVTY